MFRDISNIFFSHNKTVRLSRIFTDIHSHLLPSIDDGVKNIDESLLLIKELNLLGFSRIITTPHVISDSFKNNQDIILNKLKLVQTAVKNEGLPVEIHAAAEYYVDEYFEDLLDKNEILTLGNNYLLFEISYLTKPTSLEGIIFKMISSGYKPVLAHPERYQYLYDKKLKQYKDLKQLGLFFQLNLPSLTNAYSSFVKHIAHELIDNRMVDFIGTDLHNEKQLNHIKNAVTNKYYYKLLELSLLNDTL